MAVHSCAMGLSSQSFLRIDAMPRTRRGPTRPADAGTSGHTASDDPDALPRGDRRTGRVMGGRVGANPTLPRLSPGTIPGMDQEHSTAGAIDDQYDEARDLLDDARRRLREVPAEVVVANHVMGLYELAAIHLADTPPDLAQARLAIDAVGCLVDGLGDRLGDDAAVLVESLSTLRLAFVQVSAQQG